MSNLEAVSADVLAAARRAVCAAARTPAPAPRVWIFVEGADLGADLEVVVRGPALALPAGAYVQDMFGQRGGPRDEG